MPHRRSAASGLEKESPSPVRSRIRQGVRRRLPGREAARTRRPPGWRRRPKPERFPRARSQTGSRRAARPCRMALRYFCAAAAAPCFVVAGGKGGVGAGHAGVCSVQSKAQAGLLQGVESDQVGITPRRRFKKKLLVSHKAGVVPVTVSATAGSYCRSEIAFAASAGKGPSSCTRTQNSQCCGAEIAPFTERNMRASPATQNSMSR